MYESKYIANVTDDSQSNKTLTKYDTRRTLNKTRQR